MLGSTTDFGRRENMAGEYRISAKMKVVNHRHLDLNIKMPRRFNYFGASIRTFLKKHIQRGKADLSISYEDYRPGNICLKYDRALVAECVECFYKMSDEFGIQNDVKTSALVKFPKVSTMGQMPDDEEHLWKILSGALREAVVRFMESREIKGEHLKRDLLSKLNYMETLVDFIEERFPQILTEYRNGLEDRVRELLNNIAMEGNRIAAEVTIYIDKTCVDEKTVRLRSHIHNTRNGLLSGESVGRKLGFIAQETDRETNTILSKPASLSILDRVIALKAGIEKVREQIQNIEWIGIPR